LYGARCAATLSADLLFAAPDTGRAWKRKKNIEYIPEFHKSFRHPRYWGAWLGVAAIAGIALTPASFRDPILANSDGSPEDWEKAPVAEHRSIYPLLS
jgi:lauroyl-KDO2-lipid IV(A) myristoyltransferase